MEAFGIDVESDNSTMHPQHFCLACQSVLRKKRDTTLKHSAYRAQNRDEYIFKWAPHQDIDCPVSTERSFTTIMPNKFFFTYRCVLTFLHSVEGVV